MYRLPSSPVEHCLLRSCPAAVEVGWLLLVLQVSELALNPEQVTQQQAQGCCPLRQPPATLQRHQHGPARQALALGLQGALKLARRGRPQLKSHTGLRTLTQRQWKQVGHGTLLQHELVVAINQSDEGVLGPGQTLAINDEIPEGAGAPHYACLGQSCTRPRVPSGAVLTLLLLRQQHQVCGHLNLPRQLASLVGLCCRSEAPSKP